MLPGAKTTPPTVVPVGLKPVMVPDASLTPTLPITTEVPVFEMVPPRRPHELAVPRFTIGVPKTGTPAATPVTNQINLCRKGLRSAYGTTKPCNKKNCTNVRWKTLGGCLVACGTNPGHN